MSRIGKKAISVPAGVKVAISGGQVNIEGPKGKLSLKHRPEVKVSWTESEKSLKIALADGVADVDTASMYWGTTRALLNNMIDGVTKGYEKSLEVVGVGWQATVMGKKLKLAVGLANAIEVPIPAGLTVAVDKAIVKINGADKQAVGQFAAEVRSKRKPEPYNGKGIKYTDETIRRKQGKQFGA